MKKSKTMELHAALRAGKDHTAQKGQAVVSITFDGAYVISTPFTTTIFSTARALDVDLNRWISTVDGWVAVPWSTVPSIFDTPHKEVQS